MWLTLADLAEGSIIVKEPNGPLNSEIYHNQPIHVRKGFLSRLTMSQKPCVCVLVTQSCPTLWDPMNCSLPGSSIHEIFQTRILEWLPFPSPRDLSNQGIKLGSSTVQADALPSEPLWQPPNLPWRAGHSRAPLPNLPFCLLPLRESAV